MGIESKGYVATPEDIRDLAITTVDSVSTAEACRGTYLKALVATTQHELGSPPRVRPARPADLSPEDRTRQLAALEAVHERFYAVVFAALTEKLGRSADINRAATFARTSASTLRTWLRAGNDVTSLAAARVAKAALRIDAQPRTPSAGRLRIAVDRQTKLLLETVGTLATVDKPMARQECKTIIEAVTEKLKEIGPLRRRAVRAANSDLVGNHPMPRSMASHSMDMFVGN